MIEVILLDSGPLGLVTNPKSNPENLACKAWMDDRLNEGCQIIIPAIIDYEVRRELIRANKTAGLRRLDELYKALEFLSLTDAMLRHAAELWAHARALGRQTAADNMLDVDMILAAQALSLNNPDAIIATTNIDHLTHFVSADVWRNIT